MRVNALAVVMLACHAMAQQPSTSNGDAANPSDADKQFASVEGKLIDAATGEPVRKANLVLMQMPSGGGGVVMTGPRPSTTVSSDADGKSPLMHPT